MKGTDGRSTLRSVNSLNCLYYRYASSTEVVRMKSYVDLLCRSRFVDWVEGNSQHITTEEMYHHDDNPSPQLPFDADDD